MWKNKIWENRKFRLLVLLEVMLLAIGIVGLIPGNRIEENEDTMEILLNGGEYLEERGGWYIDGSFNYNGTFLTARTGRLRPGVYELRMELEAGDNEVSSFGIESMSGEFYGLLSNRVNVYGGAGEQTCQFYVTGTAKEAQITVNYGGGQPLLVKSIELVHTNAGSRIFIFLVLAVSALANTLTALYFYVGSHPVAFEKKLVWFGIPALAVLASCPLFVDYMIIGEESVFHWTRIEALAQSVSRGDIPARIESLWLYGHGYANSIFCCDTFLVLPALLRLIGFDMNVSYGIYVFAVNLATALIAYFCFKGCFKGRYIGMFGSMLYTLAPYRIYNIYNRGAVGAYTAITFLPLLVYGFYLIFTGDILKKEYKRYWLLPVLGFSGILQSHIPSCMMAGIFTIACCLIMIKKVFRRQTLWELARVVLGTVVLNLWYLVPLADMTVSGKYNFNLNTGSHSYFQESGGVAAVCLVFAVCVGASKLLKSGKRIWKYSFFAVLCGASVLYSMYQTNDILLTGSGILRLYSAEALGNSGISGAEYLPEGAQLSFSYHDAVPSEGVSVTAYEKKNLDTLTELVTENGNGEYWLELPMLLYKGYRAADAETGQRFEVTAGDNHVVRVLLPEGYRGTVRTWYAGMWYWRVTELISVLFAVYIIFFGIKKHNFHFHAYI